MFFCMLINILYFKIHAFHLTFSSVQFSSSVMSDCLQPHDLQHSRPPCSSRTPRVHPNPCPSSWWCHPAISSSVVPSPPAPSPSQNQSLFQWVNSSPSGGQNIGSFSFSINPSNEHPGPISFRMDWLDLLAVSMGRSRVFSNTTLQKHQFFCPQLSL